MPAKLKEIEYAEGKGLPDEVGQDAYGEEGNAYEGREKDDAQEVIRRLMDRIDALERRASVPQPAAQGIRRPKTPQEILASVGKDGSVEGSDNFDPAARFGFRLAYVPDQVVEVVDPEYKSRHVEAGVMEADEPMVGVILGFLYRSARTSRAKYAVDFRPGIGANNFYEDELRPYAG